MHQSSGLRRTSCSGVCQIQRRKAVKRADIRALEKLRRFDLPSAPSEFLRYAEENDRPQPKLDRDAQKGMQVTLGRLREDSIFDYKFIGLSHNTLRGAAGGAVLIAELLADKGYITSK